MTLRLNGATSGFTEIDSPAIAGSNTLLLPGSNGSAYQFLRNGATAGTTEFAGSITSGTAVASTSGTSIDFTSIPSYVKRVTVMFNGVSTNGTSVHLIQIGDSGGVEATGYAANAFNYGTQSTYTAGYGLQTGTGPSVAFSGAIVILLLTSNTWVASGNLSSSGSGDAFAISGSKTLSGTLDRVRITTVGGTNTFDAGSINILYEG